MLRYGLIGMVLVLGACSAPEQEPEAAPGVDTGYYIEGGLIRGSYAPSEISREALHATIRQRCPRLRGYRELVSYTPGVIGFQARCR